MNIAAAISVIIIAVMFRSLKCNGNKTVLVIGQLESKRREKETELGIKLAYDVAQNSSDFKEFLGKYAINFSRMDTLKDPSNAVVMADYLLTQPSSGPYAQLILGPHTPPEATAVLNLVRFYKKLMVTYLTTTAQMKELDNDYGFTFKPTAFTFNKAIIKMVEFFGWKRAAVVYDFLEDGGLYVRIVDKLAEEANFKVIAFAAINSNTNTVTKEDGDKFEDIKRHLQKLKDLDTKIFIGEFGVSLATLVFCQLYKMEMYGPEYVWILNPGAGTVDYWVSIADKELQRNESSSFCSREQYQQAVDGTFIVDASILRNDVNTTTASGLTLQQFFNKPKVINMTDPQKFITTTAFDVMWAVLLAMAETSKELAGESYGLEMNSELYGKTSITRSLREKLKNVSFEGLTGPVSFSDKEEREGITVLKQYQDGGTKLVPVGEHFTKENRLMLYNNASKSSLWKDNRIPSDSTVKHIQPTDIPPALFIIFSTAASFGILLGIIFLVFNRYYRRYKFIRLSAPMFNDVMVLGCIMCLSTVFLFGLRDLKDPHKTMPRVCKARAWILNIGFSLAFGAMFIKTWRIYKICTNKRLKVRLGPLSDWSMLAMVGGIVLIDVATLVAWEIEDQLQHTVFNLTEEYALRDPNDPYKVIILTLNTCTAKNLELWLALIYVYKGILLLYGLFLAYETRNVVYAHLNDSRVIGICVYNVVVLSMIGAFLAIILNNEQFRQLYAALSVCIIFPATATISLIFIPKLIHRLKMNSLDDETGETSVVNGATRPSIDLTSTCYGTEMGRERFVADKTASTNTLCVYQNGGLGSLSPIPSPTPPTAIQELSAKTLED